MAKALAYFGLMFETESCIYALQRIDAPINSVTVYWAYDCTKNKLVTKGKDF